MATRQELEDRWRSRVTQAQAQYKQAVAKYYTLSQERREGLTPSPDGLPVVSKAHQEEAAALQEYVRVLRIFTDLIVQGRMPPDE